MSDFDNLEIFYLLKIKMGTNICASIDAPKGKYKVLDEDIAVYKEASNNFYTVVMFFEEIQNKKVAKKINIISCNKSSKFPLFEFRRLVEVNHDLRTENFLRLISLNLDGDFKFNSYFTKEYANEIFKDFYYSVLKEQYNTSLVVEKFDEQKFNDRKQHDVNAITMYQISSSERPQFQRDRDRIAHSKANRRLVDKAQIFTSSKGDHYRTRMTHTIAVTQIARSIARLLNLSEDLTEAIAIGHDLGHTPFGHQGERTLDFILCGENIGKDEEKKNDRPIIKNILEFDDLKQRFKHNYQALRILTLLENKYPEYAGLNLSYQVMEGIWKHTDINAKHDEIQFDLTDFFKYNHIEFMFPNNEYASTLEGQVVAIADEIAQRSHDIDDAFKSHKMTHDSFMKYTNIKKVEKLKSIDTEILDRLNKMKNQGVVFIDIDDMYRAQFSSRIIDLLITDVVEKTKLDFEKIPIPENNRYSDKLIDFSQEGKTINNLLESIVTRQVINSSEVARFDKTASRIVYKLFKFYYENPLCLEKSTLIRIYKEMSAKYDNCINFTNSDLKLIRKEINMIINLDLGNEKNDLIRNEYLGKRKILVRCIADHIGGMTDTFALSEYRKLYSGEN